MENFEKSENFDSEKVGQQKDTFQDSDFIKNWDRAYLRVFKKWSWDLAWNQRYAWKFFLIFLIIFAIHFVASIFDAIFSTAIWLEENVSLTLFGGIADLVTGVWLLGFGLNIAKWLVQEVNNFFREITWDRVWKTFLAWLLFWLIVILWFVCLIIPWLIFSVRFQFFNYAIVDKWMWPIDALKYSWNITKWRFWEIIWFDLYFGLINILWILCLIIGLIWTIPMTQMAMARYYRLISDIYEKNNKWNS